MIIITCVLKVGEFYNNNNLVTYTPQHVQWLAKQVKEHLTIPHRFVCLSNVEVESIKVFPLIHNWTGWWSKLELFRPNVFYDKVFYIDLDTVITGNINHIVNYPHSFTTLRQISQASYQNNMGSGVMCWNPLERKDLINIYNKFKNSPDKYINTYITSDKWGDQRFIQDNIKQYPEFFQTLFPNEFVSYKRDLNYADPTPENKFIIFHGKDKPEHYDKPWIPKM